MVKPAAEPAHGIYLGPAMPAVTAATPSQDARGPTRPPPGLVGFTRDQGEPLEPLSAALAEALEAYDVDVVGAAAASRRPRTPAPARPATARRRPPAERRPARPLGARRAGRWSRRGPSWPQARTRDEVVVTTLRYARDFFQFAALFAVTRDAVAGHDGLGPDGDARDLARTVAIYANDPGIFRTAIETTAPYLGRVDRAAPGNQAVLDALGRGSPRTVLVTPILLRRRPVCLLYGDNGRRPGLGAAARRPAGLLLHRRRRLRADHQVAQGGRTAPMGEPPPGRAGEDGAGGGRARAGPGRAAAGTGGRSSGRGRRRLLRAAGAGVARSSQ